MSLRRPFRLLLIAIAALVPMLVTSFAWACTPVAEVRTEESYVYQGGEVRGSGEGFSPSAAGDAEIRLDGEAGQLLWQGRPDQAGSLSFAFTMPEVSPGNYVLLAVQREANGEPVYGTPARTTIAVGARPAAAQSSATAAESEPAPATAPAPAPAPAPAVQAAAAPAAAPAPEPIVAPEAGPAEKVPAFAFEERPRPMTPEISGETDEPTTAAAAPSGRGPEAPTGGSLLVPFALIGIGVVLASSAAAVALRSGRDEPRLARRQTR